MGTGIGQQFQKMLSHLVAFHRMEKVLETGTFTGNGSTKCLSDALEMVGPSSLLWTIEINHRYLKIAQDFCKGKANIVYCLGSSVPKNLVPTVEDTKLWIESNLAENPKIRVDYKGSPEKYVEESSGQYVIYDLLGLLIPKIKYDLILLDSAGHIGFVEFSYLMTILNYPTFIALDDINHIKHWKTSQQIFSDKRFEVIFKTDERYGSDGCKFTP